jgi:hypothetical protein
VLKVRYIFLCEGASVDQFSNQVTAFQIIEDMTLPSFPMLIPKFAAVASLVKADDDPDEQVLAFRILLNGEEIVSQEIHPLFRGKEKTSSRVVFNFGGLPLMAPGVLEARIEKDNHVLASYSVTLKTLQKVEVQNASELAPKADVITEKVGQN